jgi:hypothetical protein
MPQPRTADLFGDAASPVEMVERFEEYKEALNKSARNPVAPAGGGQAAPESESAQLQKALGSDLLSKALSPELLASVRESLAQTDLGKDLLVAGPGSTGGLVAYDLEAPAKLLAPRPTPLRNRIARRRGVGTAHQFKRITGFSGSGTGGVATPRPGITETGQTTWGGQTLRRPPAISYSGDQSSVPYLEFGASDSVSWRAQFAGQGYQDIRQLSQSSVLYSSMLQEERLLLGGRGTVGSFSGALAAPTAPTSTPIAAVAATGYAPITGYTTNIYVRVTSESVFGDSVPCAVATVVAASGSYIAVTGVTLPANATGMKVYAGTGASDPGIAGSYYVGRQSSGSTPFIIQGALPVANGSPATNNIPAADTSASALDYDGILTYCTSAQSGYLKNISAVTGAGSVVGALSANPGNEFNVAFASLYDSVKASPDEILANGNDRKQLSDLLKTSSSSNYRINLTNEGDAHGAQLGAMVTSIQNEVTGDIVNITVHPWLPQGNMPIISWTLPLPDSNVSDVFSVYDVQPIQMIEWPVNQLSYDVSSYWFGTFVCYAPAWCGAITGITKV